MLLCTDGISDYVSIDEMQIILSMDTLFDDKIKMIQRLAERNGSTDNMSIIGLISEHQLSEHDLAIARRHEREKELAELMRQARKRKNADLEELSASSLNALKERLSKKYD